MTYSDIYLRQTRLDDMLRKFGASMVGFCSVSDMEVDICKRYPVGISIVLDLDRDAVADLVNDDRRYNKTTQTAKDRLYRVYGVACQLLRSWGYGYVPLPDYPLEETLTDMAVDVPLHWLAAKAGLGWIGKSGMLITSRYGPRVRLGGLLTDAPFERSRPAPGVNDGRCGDCRACIDACPVGAIRGASGPVRSTPIRDGRQEHVVDAHLCNNWRRESLAAIGRKAECGLCVAVCPIGVDSTPDLSLVKVKVHQLAEASTGGLDEVVTTPATSSQGAELQPDWMVGASVAELTPQELAFLLSDDDLFAPLGDGDESPDEALVAELMSDDEPEVDPLSDSTTLEVTESAGAPSPGHEDPSCELGAPASQMPACTWTLDEKVSPPVEGADEPLAAAAAIDSSGGLGTPEVPVVEAPEDPGEEPRVGAAAEPVLDEAHEPEEVASQQDAAGEPASGLAIPVEEVAQVVPDRGGWSSGGNSVPPPRAEDGNPADAVGGPGGQVSRPARVQSSPALSQASGVDAKPVLWPDPKPPAKPEAGAETRQPATTAPAPSAAPVPAPPEPARKAGPKPAERAQQPRPNAARADNESDKPPDKAEARAADGTPRQGPRRRRPAAAKPAPATAATPSTTGLPATEANPPGPPAAAQAPSRSTRPAQARPAPQADTTLPVVPEGQPAPKKRASRPRRRPPRPRTGEAGPAAGPGAGSPPPSPAGGTQGS